ncbi:MAG: 4-alpha-glucanotransferase, partial [Gammaproteobacteria bacterium]|nr:4-alpha-glucanotransferase [Gammaproteobacteria bacterium]
MPITDHAALDALCARCGIALEYHDIRGRRYQPGVDVKRSLLAALRLPVDDDDDVHRNLDELESRSWRQVVATAVVRRQGEFPIRVTLNLGADQIGGAISWQLHEESGQRHEGQWEIDARDAIGAAVVDGARVLRFEVTLPDLAYPGYHRLNLVIANGSEAHSTVIVAPQTCYQPPELDQGGKTWGVSLQLFSLRSRRNWGIGDFTDLHAVVETLAPLGIDVLGLNPLHALFPHLPENASPYSPSSRDFVNPVYLDIEAIDEFKHNREARRQAKDSEFQAVLGALRELELIDYTRVWELKLRFLRLLYEAFRQNAGAARLEAFKRFQQDGGDALFKFSLFEALQASFYRQDPAIDGWHKWPQTYQDPDSEAVSAWAERHRDEIEFHQYLQWNAGLQLSAIQRSCQSHGMCIGIYRDLAVGVEQSSAQCWAEQPGYAQNIGTGAPPDDFNLKGQNWELPPPQPGALAERAYRSFILTLRANMRHAGALRIDHIMGLMRLYWVPPGCQADAGTYVSYPFADLLGILALESQRNRCLVIGEDLGTVPNDVRHALYVNRILSYRILFFEKDWERGTMKPPADYPRYALCTSGSHDLPTLRGYWQGT